MRLRLEADALAAAESLSMCEQRQHCLDVLQTRLDEDSVRLETERVAIQAERAGLEERERLVAAGLCGVTSLRSELNAREDALRQGEIRLEQGLAELERPRGDQQEATARLEALRKADRKQFMKLYKRYVADMDKVRLVLQQLDTVVECGRGPGKTAVHCIADPITKTSSTSSSPKPVFGANGQVTTGAKIPATAVPTRTAQTSQSPATPISSEQPTAARVDTPPYPVVPDVTADLSRLIDTYLAVWDSV
jgi:hypothetical protein